MLRMLLNSVPSNTMNHTVHKWKMMYFTLFLFLSVYLSVYSSLSYCLSLYLVSFVFLVCPPFLFSLSMSLSSCFSVPLCIHGLWKLSYPVFLSVCPFSLPLSFLFGPLSVYPSLSASVSLTASLFLSFALSLFFSLYLSLCLYLRAHISHQQWGERCASRTHQAAPKLDRHR